MDGGTELLAYFDRPNVQEDILDVQYVKILPTQQPVHTQMIEFYIPRNTEQFIDLQKSCLFVTVQIQRKDKGKFKRKAATVSKRSVGDEPTSSPGTSKDTLSRRKRDLYTPIDIKDDHYALPINNIAHSMFKNVELEDGTEGTSIYNSNNHYPYVAYLRTLLWESTELKSNVMETTEGWVKDSFKDWADNDAVSNNGATRRLQAFVQKDGTPIRMTFAYPLRGVDFWREDKLLLNGMDLRLKLTPAGDDFTLLSNYNGDNNSRARLNIEDIHLNLCKVVLHPQVVQSLSSRLGSSVASAVHTRSEIRMFHIPTGSQHGDRDPLYMGILPYKVFVFFVDAAAYNGSRSKNPFKFQNLDVEFIALYINDKPVPHRGYQLNFSDEDDKNTCIHAWRQLLCTTAEDSLVRPTDISFQEFLQGYTIFAFNVNPMIGANIKDKRLPAPKYGNMRLEARFRSNTTTPMNCMIYGLFVGATEISGDRQVIPPGNKSTPFAQKLSPYPITNSKGKSSNGNKKRSKGNHSGEKRKKRKKKGH